jgi:hypothetical protein
MDKCNCKSRDNLTHKSRLRYDLFISRKHVQEIRETAAIASESSPTKRRLHKLKKRKQNSYSNYDTVFHEENLEGEI